MGDRNKVTIYDLARRLNTTASTVSRAMQNNPRISLKMREAVQALARELHYLPDPVAHHLRTGRGSVLGIIVPRIDRNFFAAIISSFQAAAQRSGYDVLIAASNESIGEEQKAVRAMLAKKVDGLALSLSVEGTGYGSEDGVLGIPIVYFDRVPSKPGFDTVSNDNFRIGYDAVVHLYRAGCQKIGHFAGPYALKSYADRFNGYRQALADLGLPYRESRVFPNCITMETGIEAARTILAASDRPDGIFSAGDFPAITAIDLFHSEGISVPQDIAIIGVANEPLDGYLSTPLSSFDLHQQNIGESTAELLLARIRKDENEAYPKPTSIIVKHDLFERKSSLRT